MWLRLWLRHRPAAAALIPPLTWEFPYAVGAALKKQKRKRRKKLGVPAAVKGVKDGVLLQLLCRSVSAGIRFPDQELPYALGMAKKKKKKKMVFSVITNPKTSKAGQIT